ncbi:MAG: hypothetical protein RL033_1597 [Pseudomonadota bacterium]
MKLFCPSCGSAVEFRYDDSFVRVCAACRSALLRSDRGIETLGQFADLAPSSSGLELGDRGRWQSVGLELVGRTQYRHRAGGTWDEWYLRFQDGRWGWLSQAEGRWAVTFDGGESKRLPAFSELSPGDRVQLPLAAGLTLTVSERGEAELLSAEGEIPFAFTLGSSSRFVDLSDGQQRFATLDYGAPTADPAAGADATPQLYVGSYVSLAELGLKARSTSTAATSALAGGAVPSGTAERLACPHCGGSVELRLPGSSLTVVCPYCASVLDCEGPLRILSQLEQRSQKKPPIALGAQGTFAGVRYTVTGRLVRAVNADGQTFDWDEYLLHAPEVGYRWLVCSGGHYSFVSEVPAGAVQMQGDREARFQGNTFQLFERGEVRVLEAHGEFYWRVQAGEQVQSRDYVAPPLMLSRELSEGELHWSLGVYQSVAQVKSAFALPALPDRTLVVGPHQPFLHGHWRPVALLLTLALLLCAGVMVVLSKQTPVLAERLDLGSAAFPEPKETSSLAQHVYLYFSPGFELAAGKNLELQLQLPLTNSWAYAGIDLIHEASGELSSVGMELSHYAGVDEGEAWSEGSSSAERLMSVRNGGSHVLRVELQTPERSGRLALTLRQDVFVGSVLLLALAALGVPAIAFWLLQYAFERQRWSNSDFAPAGYASGGGDDD